jgi:hypothetical protein
VIRIDLDAMDLCGPGKLKNQPIVTGISTAAGFPTITHIAASPRHD